MIGAFDAGDDRGVSDTIGFVLVFALIISTVGLAFAGGLTSLESIRDVERVNNAERAFDVLADNLEDVRSGDAPSRATEIKLADAALYLGDPVAVNVSGVHATDSSADFSVEYEVAPLVYEAGDGSKVTYAVGSTIRQEPGGASMLRTPAFVLEDEGVVVPVLVTRAGDRTSVGGSTTVLVRTERQFRRVTVAETDGEYSAVYLNVTSPRADAWAANLERRDGVTCSVGATPNGDRASCKMTNVDRVLVSIVEVDVGFE